MGCGISGREVIETKPRNFVFIFGPSYGGKEEVVEKIRDNLNLDVKLIEQQELKDDFVDKKGQILDPEQFFYSIEDISKVIIIDYPQTEDDIDVLKKKFSSYTKYIFLVKKEMEKIRIKLESSLLTAEERNKYEEFILNYEESNQSLLKKLKEMGDKFVITEDEGVVLEKLKKIHFVSS